MTAHSSHSFRLRAILFLLANIFLWGIGPHFVKYFAKTYDPWTQNAFRYSCAAVMLVGIALLRRIPLRGLTRTQWGKLLLVAFANVALQTCFASIYYYIFPAVASLIMRLDILFICIMSFIFFHDERSLIRSPWFIGGALMGLIGVLLVLWGRDPELLARLDINQGEFWIGVALSVGYALFLALYSFSIKRAVRDVHPIASFTYVAWMTSLCLIITMCIWGHPEDILHNGVQPLFIMWLSALLCIVIAHTALYAALREIKAVVSTTLMLLTPVVTCITSAFLYGEDDRLTLLQILGGLAVLTGAWLAGMAQIKIARAHRAEAEKAAQSS